MSTLVTQLACLASPPRLFLPATAPSPTHCPSSPNVVQQALIAFDVVGEGRAQAISRPQPAAAQVWGDGGMSSRCGKPCSSNADGAMGGTSHHSLEGYLQVNAYHKILLLLLAVGPASSCLCRCSFHHG